MALPVPYVFVDGVAPTATQLQTYHDYLLAMNPAPLMKTADQSVTSSTVQVDDTHMQYTIGSTGTYVVDVWLDVTSAANAAGDIQVGFSFPTGTMRAWSGPGIDPALASGTLAQGKFAANMGLTSGTAWTDFGVSTTSAGFVIHALFTATATGTLKFQWSQFASNANATTVKAGSHMLVRQVA